MKKVFILTITLLLFQLSGISQHTAKYSNEFLNIGVGARSLGMGGAVSSGAGSIDDTYWNPSGLVHIDNDIEIGLMHAEYFAGIANYDFAGFSYKINDKNVIGGSFIRLAVDNIPNTLDLIDNNGNIRWNRISSFSSSDMAFLLSYAKKTNNENLYLGGNAKIIRRKAGDFANAWGFGIDIAASYDYGKWKFSAVARDVTSTFNAWSFNNELLKETWEETGNELPENSIEITLPSLTPAVTRSFNIYGKFSGMAEIDLYTTFDGKRNTMIKTDLLSIDPRAGVEFNYDKKVFLRAGAGRFQEIPYENQKNEFIIYPSLGAGFSIRGLTIDYAISNLGNNENFYSHVFSLSYSFNLEENQNEVKTN